MVGEDFAVGCEKMVVEPDERSREIDAFGFRTGPVGGLDGVENAPSQVGFEKTLHDPKRVVFAAIAEGGEPIEIV